MKKLLLILLCLPMIGFGQQFSDGFPDGYLEQLRTPMDWVETNEGGLYFFSPIGFNSDNGNIAYMISYQLNDGVGYESEKILIQSFGSDPAGGSAIIIEELILYQGYNDEGYDTDEGDEEPDWDNLEKERYKRINDFLSKWGIDESFIE